MAKNIIFPHQDIQWHLNTTSHDKCPRCGGRLGYLNTTQRACMGKCEGGLTWSLVTVTPEGWMELMLSSNEPNAPLTRAHRYTENG